MVETSRAAPWTLAARWIFPVDRPPIENGTLTLVGDRIHAVERKGCQAADVNLGNVAVVPGFVNAHTHLDLSGLRDKRPPSGEFTDWLRAVMVHRRSLSAAQVEADIRQGLS